MTVVECSAASASAVTYNVIVVISQNYKTLARYGVSSETAGLQLVSGGRASQTSDGRRVHSVV